MPAGNAVVVSYTSDFVMPAVYPVPINDGSLDHTSGEWASLPILDGTYTLGFWASRSFAYAANNETQNYKNTSVNDTAESIRQLRPPRSTGDRVLSGLSANARRAA